jgi:hypothetical protein
MHSLPCPDHNPAADPVDHPEPAPTGVDITHPAWCHLRICTAWRGGPHLGQALLVDTDRIGSARLQLQLWSPADDPTPTALIELVATDCDSGEHLCVDLSVHQMRQLVRLVAAIAAQADLE